MIASPSDDGTVRLWDADTGSVVHTLKGHSEGVACVDWSSDGRWIASGSSDNTIKVWDSESGRLSRTLEGHTDYVSAVAWSPNGKELASAADETIRIWDTTSGKSTRILAGQIEWSADLAWSPDGKMLAFGSQERDYVGLWTPATKKDCQKFKGHSGGVYKVAWLPKADSVLLATCGQDSSIRIWDVVTQRQTFKLERDTSAITCLAFSADQLLLASKSEDSVRLWLSTGWKQLAQLPIEPGTWLRPGMAFHPRSPILAMVGSDPHKPIEETLIFIWDLDLNILLDKTSQTVAQPQAIHHTTAKIVLVGDSGVGKTGLGWRLAHDEFKEHASTHGQQFWVLDQLGTRRADGTDCEAILWDLAGQPDYRLTHALFLDDADLALVLFDPTDSRDPLHGVEFWLKQLKAGWKQTQAKDSCQTILVGARTDRGDARLTQNELDAFCKQRAIKGGYLPTSAKEGIGLDELLLCMKERIPWEQKSATVTTVTFKRIKDYILSLKENPRRRKVIVTPLELRKRLEKTDKKWEFADAEMMTAVGHLANYGYVRVLRTSKGEERILLAPELLNNLAASFVLEARRNPKGLGSLEEKRLLTGGYQFRELENLSPEERDVLLDSAALLFLRHSICFRETDPLNEKSFLVFPELINLKKPVLDDEQPTEDGVGYTINGAVENVYASLVVLLGYTQTFTRTDQWNNQARYEIGDGLICGFRQEGERDGELDIVLYFGTNVGKPVRTLFQGLFESFLARRNLSVSRYEPVNCSNNHALNRGVVRDETRNGSAFAFCPRCGERMALPKADEPIQLTQTERRKVDEQRWIAERRTRFEQAVFQLASYVESQKLNRPECFVSYAWGDKEQERWVERNLATDLQKAGIGVLLDRWENARVGASIPRFIDRIEKSDRVIVIGTPLYRKKYENKDSTTGYVVAAEVDLISSRLVGTEAEKETVLPALLVGEERTSLPPLLHRRVHADFRNERRYFITAFDLILDLYGISHGDAAVSDLRDSLGESEMR